MKLLGKVVFLVLILSVWFNNAEAFLGRSQIRSKGSVTYAKYDQFYASVAPEERIPFKWNFAAKFPGRIILYNAKSRTAALLDASSRKIIGLEAGEEPIMISGVDHDVCIKHEKFLNNNFEQGIKDYDPKSIPEHCWRYLNITSTTCKPVAGRMKTKSTTLQVDGTEPTCPEGETVYPLPPHPPSPTSTSKRPTSHPQTPDPELPPKTSSSSSKTTLTSKPSSTTSPTQLPSKPSDPSTPGPPSTVDGQAPSPSTDGEATPPPTDGEATAPTTDAEETSQPTEPETDKKRVLQWLWDFCPFLHQLVLAIGGTISVILSIVLAPIMYVLTLLKGIFVLFFTTAWCAFARGVRCFCNIFRWIWYCFRGMLGDRDRMSKFRRSGVKIPLLSIVDARNGVGAIFQILNAVSQKFSLWEIFPMLIRSPRLLSKTINGLGGMLASGVNGFFGIIGRIYDFAIGGILNRLKTFTNNLLDSIRGGRPSTETLSESANSLLSVSRSQKIKYGKSKYFIRYDSFLIGLKGRSNFKVGGVALNSIVDLIKDTLSSAKQTVLKFMNLFNPFAPMKTLVAQLFVDTITSLNTTKGPFYAKQLFPNLDIPQEALDADDRDLTVSLIVPKNVDSSIMLRPTTDVLRSMPIVKDIYKEFDDVALEYTNSTLESLLTKQFVERLVEFTSAAMGFR